MKLTLRHFFNLILDFIEFLIQLRQMSHIFLIILLLVVEEYFLLGLTLGPGIGCGGNMCKGGKYIEFAPAL